MRLTGAIALLCLVSSGAAGLSTGGQNPRRCSRRVGVLGRATSPFPATSRTAASATEQSPQSTDADVFAQVATNSEKRKRKTRKKGVARPPLVDSALLRFLSKQKRLRDQSDDGVSSMMNEKETQQSTLGNSYSLLDVLEEKSRQEYQKQPQKQQLESTSQPPSESSVLQIPSRTDDSTDLWMGQFNRNRVAKVLMTMADGVDENLANRAGDCVQRYVLARTARRRVRKFLKERDTMWVEGRSVEQVNGSSIRDKQSTEAQHPTCGFVEVVDVLAENGLTAKDIATILTHTPSIALMMSRRLENDTGNDQLGGETIEETLHRALSQLLCGTLKLRRYDARRVLRRCAGLLTKKGSRSAHQVVAAMVKLGVSTSSIARDKNGLPTLLSRPPAALFRLIAFLGSDAIRMPISKIGPLVRRTDCLELLDAVAPVPRFQPGQQATTTDLAIAVDASSEEVSDARILPAFVGRTLDQRKKLVDDTYEKMSSTAWTLRNEIGTCDLGKVIAAYPSVLLLDASEQVLAVAEYLMDELGIWEDDLARVLQLYPALLGMPIGKMKSVVSFFVSQGVEEETLTSIFRSFPAILTMNIDGDMVPVIEFLRSIGIKNVGRFISRLPPILGYSVEWELVPKWEFARDIYTYPSFELSKFPAYFSYPLDRIKARFEYLRDAKHLPISLIAPDLVLRYGDRDFAVKVAGGDDEGEAYAKYLKERENKLAGGKRRGKRQRKNTFKKKRAQ